MYIAYPKYVVVYGYYRSKDQYKLFYDLNFYANVLLAQNNLYTNSLSKSYNELVASQLTKKKLLVSFWTYKFQGESVKDVVDRLGLKGTIDKSIFNKFVAEYKPQY